MPATIRFIFDYISSYAYIAWTQIHALAEKHGYAVGIPLRHRRCDKRRGIRGANHAGGWGILLGI